MGKKKGKKSGSSDNAGEPPTKQGKTKVQEKKDVASTEAPSTSAGYTDKKQLQEKEFPASGSSAGGSQMSQRHQQQPQSMQQQQQAQRIPQQPRQQQPQGKQQQAQRMPMQQPPQGMQQQAQRMPMQQPPQGMQQQAQRMPQQPRQQQPWGIQQQAQGTPIQQPPQRMPQQPRQQQPWGIQQQAQGTPMQQPPQRMPQQQQQIPQQAIPQEGVHSTPSESSRSVSEASSHLSEMSISSEKSNKDSKKKTRQPRQQKQKKIDVKTEEVQPGPSTTETPTSVSKQQVQSKGGGDVKSKDDGKKPSGGDGKRVEEFVVQPKYSLQRTLGTKGRPLKISTNHLELNLGRLEAAVHHDVAIDPDRPKKLFYQVMEAFRLKFYPNFYPAFDGNKNLYSTKLLTKDKKTPLTGEVIVKEDGRDKKFEVKISFAAFVDLTELRNFFNSNSRILLPPMSAIQCIDVVLRQAPIASFIKVGRSFFSQPRQNQIIDLGDGMELYSGFFQSAILGWKPFLNVDVSHKAFPKNVSLIMLIREFYGDENRPLNDTRQLEKLIRNLKIEYEIPRSPGSKRNYRVNGVDREPAARSRFKLDNGSITTVADYFKTVKNYPLRYPHLPCLWVGAKNRENKILLPVECCTMLPGQVVTSKMTENQTRNMIRYSATNTIIRKNKITDAIRNANFNNSQCVREFGLSVSNEFTQVQARVLQPPTLKYAPANPIRPSRGVWRVTNFLEGAVLNKWTILNLDSRTNQSTLFNLKDNFLRTANKLNVNCPQPVEPFETMRRCDVRELSNYFQKRQDYNLVVVVIQDAGPQYAMVKKAAEINVGVLTQCLRSRTVFRLNPSTIENILLKVNAKLNGINHTLQTRPKCMNRPCMLMGADVTHPSPDSQEPSVAAVIASHDPKAFKYNLCWRLQPSREEMITDMEAITREQLVFFYRQNRQMKPEHLIYIRDGVSDGQFDQVLNTELTAIRNACTRLDANYKPAITFIVVQKRHHTRFFPRPEDSEDKNVNVPAGTCVDTTITHPRAQDFYLVSHASIQGVAKPTKYRVLWDDKDMHEDEIEELMFYLCHMFTRCTRSVSYPAPTYYAHLAAARAKVYCDGENIDLNRLSIAQNNLTIKKEIVKDLPMFFV